MGHATRNDRSVLLLRAVRAATTSVVLWAAGLASAQTIPTYTLEVPGAGVIESIQSSSGLAVICTHYQPVKFEILGTTGGWEYGRFVPDGSPLSFPDSAYHGIYLTSRNVGSRNVWSFADVDQQYTTSTKATIPGEAANVSAATFPGWVSNSLFLDLESGYTTNGWPANPDTGGNARAFPESPNVDTNATSFIVPGDRLAYEAHTDFTDPGEENYWRRQAPGGESWFRVTYTSVTNPTTFPHQQPIHLFTATVTADPFKGGEGDSVTVDLQPVIDAITTQSAMQEGYYEDWQVVYDELFEQLTGGATEMDWVARDARRDGYLAEIRDNTTTANTYLVNIWANSSIANTHLSNINLGVGNLLQAVTPTQVPPDVPDISGSLDEVEFELDPEQQFIQADRDQLLPDGWDLPDAPPLGESKQWDFVIGISSIPMLGDSMDDLAVSVDLNPYDTWIQLAHLFIIAGFTLASIYGIIAELEKS